MAIRLNELIKNAERNIERLRTDPNRQNELLGVGNPRINYTTKSNGKIPMPKRVNIKKAIARLSNEKKSS